MPRIGGISLHNVRLTSLLAEENLLGCMYSLAEQDPELVTRFKVRSAHFPRIRHGATRSMLWWVKYGIWDRSRIFHLHGHPFWESLTILWMIKMGRKVVYTIHDQMMLSEPDSFSGVLLRLFEKLLVHKNIRWIAVNENIRIQLLEMGASEDVIQVIPAFIPAPASGKPLNQEIEDFIKDHTKIISMYANMIRKIDNKDLYGIDQAIKALAHVKQEEENVGLIVSIPNEDREKIHKNYQQLIRTLHLEDNVLLFLLPVKDTQDLWSRSDIVLRPTLTDGDSMVIREAISHKTCVIASDCVTRPPEVVLFKCEDELDLANKILESLRLNISPDFSNTASNYDTIKEVYKSLLAV